MIAGNIISNKNIKIIFKLLKKIEEGKLKITMRPNQDTWMGDIVFDIENGYKIAIFSDCFCWDYINYIMDEKDNLIYEFDRDSPISDYQVSDDIAKKIYKIYDPWTEKE